ncbi:MAG: alpha/beta hydrolase [Dehalococcoidales bacterium]|nr:alpha/beta hydrolase [Dehalococcoidales bacterium]
MPRYLLLICLIILLIMESSGSVYALHLPRIERDITYCSCHEFPLKLDIYYPENGGKLSPAILYIHGGGWYSGDKEDRSYRDLLQSLVKRGYLVAAVDYRLAPRNKFPTQLEDVNCALHFLITNSKSYGIEPDRIGIMGESAGGHLAALLALKESCCGNDVQTNYSSGRIRAVADMFGPVDLSLFFETNKSMLIEHVFNTDDPECDIIRIASPINYVTGNAPPFLIIQGEKDTVVQPEQSLILYQKLKASGATTSLILVKNAGHELKADGGPLDPSRKEIIQQIGNFFDRYLKQN